jgi:hypothetical protein
VKTGGKYWEHDNDVPLHGKASLSQYDTWVASGEHAETKRIKDCLEKGNCPEKHWEHRGTDEIGRRFVPLQGGKTNVQIERNGLAQYGDWVARDDSKENNKIQECLADPKCASSGSWTHNLGYNAFTPSALA